MRYKFSLFSQKKHADTQKQPQQQQQICEIYVHHLKVWDKNRCLFLKHLHKIIQNSKMKCWSYQASPCLPLWSVTASVWICTSFEISTVSNVIWCPLIILRIDDVQTSTPLSVNNHVLIAALKDGDLQFISMLNWVAWLDRTSPNSVGNLLVTFQTLTKELCRCF